MSVITSTRPPGGVYLIALDRRLPSTCVTRAGVGDEDRFRLVVGVHEREPRCLGRGAMLLDGLAHDVAQNDAVELHCELSRLGACKLEQILDERHERAGGAADARDAVLLLGGERAAQPFLEQLGMAVDRVNRILEVVAHAAHEARARGDGFGKGGTPFLGGARVGVGAAATATTSPPRQ